LKPKENARQPVDQLLNAASWAVQDHDQLDLSASLGVTIREFPLKYGFADYLLFVDKQAVVYYNRKPQIRGMPIFAFFYASLYAIIIELF
jgi:type I restriction enzyme R subunit